MEGRTEARLGEGDAAPAQEPASLTGALGAGVPPWRPRAGLVIPPYWMQTPIGSPKEEA